MSSPKSMSDPEVQVEEMIAAMKVIGSPGGVNLIRFLRTRDSVFWSELVTGAGVQVATLPRRLRELEDIGVVKADIPRGMRQGRSVRYSLDLDRINYLTRQLRDYMLGDENED